MNSLKYMALHALHLTARHGMEPACSLDMALPTETQQPKLQQLDAKLPGEKINLYLKICLTDAGAGTRPEARHCLSL